MWIAAAQIDNGTHKEGEEEEEEEEGLLFPRRTAGNSSQISKKN